MELSRTPLVIQDGGRGPEIYPEFYRKPMYSVYQNNSNPNLACNNAEYIWQIRLVLTPLLSSFIYFSNDMLYASFSWKMKAYCFDKKVHKNHNFPPMGIGHFFFQS
jgi:hypothetical protein